MSSCCIKSKISSVGRLRSRLPDAMTCSDGDGESNATIRSVLKAGAMPWHLIRWYAAKVKLENSTALSMLRISRISSGGRL